MHNIVPTMPLIGESGRAISADHLKCVVCSFIGVYSDDCISCTDGLVQSQSCVDDGMWAVGQRTERQLGLVIRQPFQQG